jgi:hypothetical protein
MALYALKSEIWPRELGWLVPEPNAGANCTALQFAVCLRAYKDLGICEVPEGSNRGTRLDRMAKRAGSPLGSYWCAIWAGLVFADVGALIPMNFPGTDYWTPYLVPKPTIGAAVLYGVRKKGPVRDDMNAHHIGIVVRLSPYILTVEGNRSWAGSASNNGEAVDIGRMMRKDILGYFWPKAAPR